MPAKVVGNGPKRLGIESPNEAVPVVRRPLASAVVVEIGGERASGGMPD